MPTPSFRRRSGAAPILLLLASACVAPKQVEAPPPAPLPVVAPPAPAASTDWRDFPPTIGDWRYVPTAGGSSALFGRVGGPPDFAARCDMVSRSVSLSRAAGTVAAPATMAITTSAGNRTLAAMPAAGALTAALPARDPFLDKMAFSRGRFVVTVTGAVRLVIPSWPEFARVIEDCRG